LINTWLFPNQEYTQFSWCFCDRMWTHQTQSKNVRFTKQTKRTK